MCKTKMTLYILWELRVYTNTNYENQEVQSYVLLSLSNAQYTYSTHGYSALVDGMNIRELNHVFFLTLFVLSFCIEVVVEQENFFLCQKQTSRSSSSISLIWTGTPSRRSDCSKPHPSCSRTLPGYPRLLWQPVPAPQHFNHEELFFSFRLLSIVLSLQSLLKQHFILNRSFRLLACV